MNRWSKSGSSAQKAVQPAPPVFVNGSTGRRSRARRSSRTPPRATDTFLTFLYTNDYDLSQHKDVHLGYYSHYAQNQDSSGSVEYSIDEGETWLPMVYMIDRDDIVKR